MPGAGQENTFFAERGSGCSAADAWRSIHRLALHFPRRGCFFDDIYPENIQVGRNVRLTAVVRILAHFFDTKFQPTPARPFRFYQGKVVIGDNVFIGVNVVIAKPVTIGEGAVIGANSVVTRDIPPRAIAVGAPARVVGERPAAKTNGAKTT